MSEERFRSIAQSSTVGIVLTSNEGEPFRFEFVNKWVENNSGYSAEEYYSFTPEQIIALYHPDDWNRLLEYIPRILSGEYELDPLEIRFIRKDGEIMWILDEVINMHHLGEGLALSIITDISEQKRAEAHVQKSEERYRNLLDNLPQKIYYKNKDSTYITANPAFAADFDFAPKEIVGKSDSDLFPPDLAQEYQVVDQAILESGETYEADEIYIVNRLKSFIHHIKAPISDEKGNAIGILGIFWDISNQKKAQNELIEALDHAEFFVDLMSHDLTNINQALFGNLELVQLDDNLSEQSALYISQALRNVDYSTQLITEVQKFRLLKEEHVDLAPMDIEAALSKAENLVNENLPRKEIQIKTNIRPGEFVILADEYLHDIFYNLIHNSAKFDVNPVVEIDVTATLDGENLLIEVADHGSGIPDKMKNLLFSRISKKKEGFWGIGFGLTLVKQIIDRYQGTARIEDRVKGDYTQGAKFVIRMRVTNS